MLGLYIVLIVTATCLWYGSMLMFIIKLDDDLLSEPAWYKLLWLVFVVFAPILLPAYGAYYYFKQH